MHGGVTVIPSRQHLHRIDMANVYFLQVGPKEHVICALSGGVDSTVAATLVHKVNVAPMASCTTALAQQQQCSAAPNTCSR